MRFYINIWTSPAISCSPRFAAEMTNSWREVVQWAVEKMSLVGEYWSKVRDEVLEIRSFRGRPGKYA